LGGGAGGAFAPSRFRKRVIFCVFTQFVFFIFCPPPRKSVKILPPPGKNLKDVPAYILGRKAKRKTGKDKAIRYMIVDRPT